MKLQIMRTTWMFDMPQADQVEPMQHPINPQVSFDVSGSTASFYRGSGPAIRLSVEQILQNSNAPSSATSEEVISELSEVHLDLPTIQLPTLTEGQLFLSVPLKSILAPSLKRSWGTAFPFKQN
jgi:hypothetical protein